MLVSVADPAVRQLSCVDHLKGNCKQELIVKRTFLFALLTWGDLSDRLTLVSL